MARPAGARIPVSKSCAGGGLDHDYFLNCQSRAGGRGLGRLCLLSSPHQADPGQRGPLPSPPGAPGLDCLQQETPQEERSHQSGHHTSSPNSLLPPGLFFLDGEEWWAARRKLNPLFLKPLSLQRLHSVVEDNTEALIGGWNCGDNIVGLEAQLYSWSTSTMLGTGDLIVKLRWKYCPLLDILLGANALLEPSELSTLGKQYGNPRPDLT